MEKWRLLFPMEWMAMGNFRYGSDRLEIVVVSVETE
jgi:hypothetical protein